VRSLETVSTHQAPIEQRSAFFHQQMRDRFSIGLSVQSERDKPLSAEVAAYCGRRLQFAALTISEHETFSAPIKDGRPQRLMVTMQDEGTAAIRQDGRGCELLPGQYCVVDPARPFHIETGRIRVRSVYLDRAHFIECLPQIEAVTARSIEGKTGPGAIFRAMFDEMFRLAPNLDENTADALADSMPMVLAKSLHSLNRDLLPKRRDTKLRLFHKQRIRRYARASLRDPRLDAEAIAEGVNLSLRYIFELFSDESLSLMKWVWAERLAGCKYDLESPALLGRSIGEIAYAWGFVDIAHFSHAFKQKYAVSPRAYRLKRFADGTEIGH
jgi:AraC-like DNA-binding protein